MIKSFWYSINKFIKIDKFNTISYLLTNLIIVPLTVLELILTQYMVTQISDLSTLDKSASIYIPIILLFGILYINGVAGSLKAICETNLTEHGLYEQERLILEKTLKLSISDLDNNEVKDLREKAKRLNLIKVLTTFTSFFTNILSFIILTTILFFYKSIYIILIILLLVSFNSIIQKWGAKKLEIIEQKQTASNRLSKYLFNLLTNRETIQEIRIFTVYNYLKSKFKDIYMRNFQESNKAKNKIQVTNSVSSIVAIIVNVVCMVILVLIINKNEYKVGVYVLLSQILIQLSGNMSIISNNFSAIKVINMQFDQYQKFLNMEEIPINKISNVEQHNNDSAIRISFQNVSFCYPGTEGNALKDINIQIKPGEKVAIVGKNGSGKSTFIKLLLGLYLPTDGSIKYYIDKKEIKYYEISQYTRIVFQDFIKLLRPIRENIAIGKINDLDNNKKLMSALENAHSHFTEDQLDEYIGPEFGGRDISGGQWQSLAIARAYLDDGSMIIFDEATSALDPKAELEQLQRFLELGKNRTSIFITHRLSVAKFVDKIAVFDQGRLIEYGSHKQLYESGGLYHQMFKAQSLFYI